MHRILPETTAEERAIFLANFKRSSGCESPQAGVRWPGRKGRVARGTKRGGSDRRQQDHGPRELLTNEEG